MVIEKPKNINNIFSCARKETVLVVFALYAAENEKVEKKNTIHFNRRKQIFGLDCRQSEELIKNND